MPSRATSLKSDAYERNVNKRGKVSSGRKKDDKDQLKVGPYVLGLLLFVVIGSAVFQIWNLVRRTRDLIGSRSWIGPKGLWDQRLAYWSYSRIHCRVIPTSD